MTKARSVLMAMGSLMLTVSAMGQSFNLDSDTAVVGGAGIGAPSSALGAAAAQPGFWNAISGATATTLNIMNLSGAATTVVFTRSTAGGGNFASNNANTSGDDEKLLDDGQDLSITPGVAITYTFSGLQAGNYEVYTYAVAPDVATGTDVTTVTINGVAQNVTGPIPSGNNYVLGVTYAKHTVTGVPANGTITITAVRGNATSFGTVNGWQFKKLANCPADIAPPGGNGAVNIDDLLLVINSWGSCPAPCPPACTADISPSGGNCVVNIDDLLAVINGWGPCPP